MHHNRRDYSRFLEILRHAKDNYYIDGEGHIINDSLKEEKNDSLIINVYFSLWYSLVYQWRMNKPDAFSDYNTFNSFINICIDEYEMYDEIGTGKVNYFPYDQIASYFFISPKLKEILKGYILYVRNYQMMLDKDLVKTKK